MSLREPLNLHPAEDHWRLVVDIVMAGTTAVAIALLATGSRSAVGGVMMLLSLVVGTGWALTSRLRHNDVAFSASIAIAAGATAIIVSSMVCVLTGLWYPTGTALVVMSVSTVAHVWNARIRIGLVR